MEIILKEKINSLGLFDKVTMTGLVQNPYDYFFMADICIFPSHKGDGLMGTVLESMAVGKPVITTVDNGNEDVIVDGENGILIKSENVEAIINAVKDLIADDLKRKTIGENAQKFIAENLFWEKNCKTLADILHEVILRSR